MLTLFPEQAQTITDLAASLTDEALEIVGGVTARGDSVETELKLWRALTAELKHELRGRYSAPRNSVASLDGALQRVVNRAALRVIAERSPFSESRTIRSDRSTSRLSQV